MEKINEQQKLMMEQQQKFMEMMMNAGMYPPTAPEGKGKGGIKPDKPGRGKPGKLVPPRKCGECGKDGVRHKDEDCWENEVNADNRPKWWKHKE